MSKNKDARRQEDIARQREEVNAIGNSWLAQLVPGSQEYNDLAAAISQYAQNVASPEDEQSLVRALGQKLVSQQQQRIAEGGAATPLEARTNAAFDRLRTEAKPQGFEQDVLRVLTGESPTTAFGQQLLAGTTPTLPEQELLNALQGLSPTTPIGRVFGNAVNRAATPTVDDTAFRNAMKLVEDRVNTEAAGRGLLGSGLRLEQLGRAGTEAAVAEAQRQDRLRQEAYANALGLFDTGRQIPAAYRDANADLYNAGEGLRERGLGVENSLVNMQLGREGNLTGILNNNSAARLTDLSQLFQRQTSRAQDVSDFYTQLAENDKRALEKSLVQVGGIAASAIPGVGPFLTAGANAVAGNMGSTPTAAMPTTAGQIQAAQQANPSTMTNPVSQLTRQSSHQTLDLRTLLELLKQAGMN